MIYSIYSKFDSTIYERTESLNTGTDSILELSHATIGSASYNSRILMKFDISQIQEKISAGKIPTGSTSYFLQLRTAEVQELPQEYTIYAYAISGSWSNGTGKYFNTPPVTDGVSWKYRFSKTNGTQWGIGTQSGSYYFTQVSGGGTWWNNTECTQSFSFESSDIYMDVTPIVNKWITGSGALENNGIVLKFGTDIESSNEPSKILRFFSTDSNTIYVPRLFAIWDDSSFITGSLTKLPEENMVMNVKLKKYYSESENARIRVYGNTRYPQKYYTTQSYYTKNYYLPPSSYYEIRDAHTDEIIIPFDTTGSKLSCDGTSSYFNFWMEELQPERFYRVLIKTEDDGGNLTQVFDNNFYFKVTR